MEAHPEWALLYQDAIAQLWGRRDRYDDPARADYVPPARRWITQVSHSGSVPWPAKLSMWQRVHRACAGIVDAVSLG